MCRINVIYVFNILKHKWNLYSECLITKGKTIERKKMCVVFYVKIYPLTKFQKKLKLSVSHYLFTKIKALIYTEESFVMATTYYSFTALCIHQHSYNFNFFPNRMLLVLVQVLKLNFGLIDQVSRNKIHMALLSFRVTKQKCQPSRIVFSSN